MVVKAYVYNRAMLDVVFKYMQDISNHVGYEMDTDVGIAIGNLDNVEYPAMVGMSFGGEGQHCEFSHCYAIIRSVKRCDAGVEQLNANEAVLLILDDDSAIPLLSMLIDVLRPYYNSELGIGIREDLGENGEAIYILTDTQLFDHQ